MMPYSPMNLVFIGSGNIPASFQVAEGKKLEYKSKTSRIANQGVMHEKADNSEIKREDTKKETPLSLHIGTELLIGQLF